MERKPTDIRDDEHRVTERTADLRAVLAGHLETGRPVEAETLREIAHFLRSYPERVHHRKEEAYLFALLDGRGVPTQGRPLGPLLAEHQQGRALRAEFAWAVNAYAAPVRSTHEAFDAVDEAMGRDLHRQFERLAVGLENRL